MIWWRFGDSNLNVRAPWLDAPPSNTFSFSTSLTHTPRYTPNTQFQYYRLDNEGQPDTPDLHKSWIDCNLPGHLVVALNASIFETRTDRTGSSRFATLVPADFANPPALPVWKTAKKWKRHADRDRSKYTASDIVTMKEMFATFMSRCLGTWTASKWCNLGWVLVCKCVDVLHEFW